MKRILCMILALCMLVCFAACGAPAKEEVETKSTKATAEVPSSAAPTTEAATDPTEETAGESQITPLLYKVTDADGHVVWLFGSIHVGEDTYYPLPKYVMDAYKGADALAVECDVVTFAQDLGAQTAALTQMVYLDGTRISDHLPPELYERAVEVMKDCGLYISMMDMYYPILWSSFIDSSLITKLGAKTELGIDMYFLNDAHETGKEILEVESVEFQYGLLAGFSEELQILLLEGSIAGYEDLESYGAELEALMDAWESGDETAISALLSEEAELENAEEEALYAEYTEAMVVGRNENMADYAEEALKSGKEIFICVGAAHVVGEGAVADLLAQRGYTVELVTP